MFGAFLTALGKSPLGTYQLFRFWVKQLPLLRSLDPLLRDPGLLQQALESNPSILAIPADATVARSYNNEVDELKGTLRVLHPTSGRVPFKLIMVAQFALRFILCILAISGAPPTTLMLFSLFKFL